MKLEKNISVYVVTESNTNVSNGPQSYPDIVQFLYKIMVDTHMANDIPIVIIENEFSRSKMPDYRSVGTIVCDLHGINFFRDAIIVSFTLNPGDAVKAEHIQGGFVRMCDYCGEISKGYYLYSKGMSNKFILTMISHYTKDTMKKFWDESHQSSTQYEIDLWKGYLETH